MPPKRKSSEVTDNNIASAKSQRNARIEPSVNTALKKFDAEKETGIKTITYDEYLNAAIPDALLQGLGFAESQVIAAEEDETDDDNDLADNIPDVVGGSGGIFCGTAAAPTLGPGICKVVPSQPIVARPRQQRATAVPISSGVVQIPAAIGGVLQIPVSIGNVAPLTNKESATITVCPEVQSAMADPGPTDPPAMRAVRTSRRLHERSTPVQLQSTLEGTTKPMATPAARRPTTTQVDRRQTTPKATTQVATTANQSRPRMSSATASPAFGRQAGPRIVTKGNIMYERLPTGEVIASLVKKPATITTSEALSSSCSGLVTAAVAASAAASVMRPAPYRYMSPHSRVTTTQPLVAAADHCPAGYPIDDTNVVDVLEESIRATQSMRVMLMSLRDDLRRAGGAAAGGTAALTPEQVRRRRDIASKLVTVYESYKRSIDDIENVRFLRRTITAVTESNSALPNDATVIIGAKSNTLSSSGSDSGSCKHDCSGDREKEAHTLECISEDTGCVTATQNGKVSGTVEGQPVASAATNRRKAGMPSRYKEVIDVS